MRITLKTGLIVSAMAALMLSFLPIVKASPLSTVIDTLTSTITGALADHEITFTTVNTIPSGGQIKIDLPSSFRFVPSNPADVINYDNIDLLVNDVQRSLGDAATYLTDGVTMGAHSVYFTLDGGMLPAPMGGEILAGTTIKVIIGLNVVFPTALQSTKQFTNPDTAGTFVGSVTTTNASGEILDTGNLSINITSGSTPPVTLVGITESNHSTDVTESGATDTYTIWLDRMPMSDVTVTITPNSQVTVSPTSVDFSMGTWMAEKTVTVTAIDDTTVEGSHTGTITHTVTSSDPTYSGVTVASVTVHITDNDTAPPTEPITPPVEPVTPPTEPITPPAETGTSTLKMGTTTPPVEIKFSDVDDNDKLTVANKKVIYEIVNLMILKKTYKAQAKFGPNAMVTPDFAIRIALAVAGKSCGTTITPVNCKTAAVKAKLVKTGELITKNVTRAEFYRIILRASKLGFIDIKTITPAVLKKDLPKDAEFTSTKPEDVKFKGLFAQTILTAKEYKIIAWFKGTKSQAAKNFNRAAAASIVSKLLAAMASAKAK